MATAKDAPVQEGLETIPRSYSTIDYFIKKIYTGEKVNFITPAITEEIKDQLPREGEIIEISTNPNTKDPFKYKPFFKIKIIMARNLEISDSHEISIDNIVLSPEEAEKLAIESGCPTLMDLLVFYKDNIPLKGKIFEFELLEVKDEETLKEFLKYDYIISMEDSLGEKDEEFKLDDSPAEEAEAEAEEET